MDLGEKFGPTSIELADVDETKLWRRIKKGDPEAREAIIRKYIHLIKYVLNRLVSLPHLSQEILDYDDLHSCGVMGLIAAVDHYDPHREIKFITYAIPRIRGAIIDELRAVDWLPRSLRQKVNRMQKAYATLENQLNRPATEEEMCHYLEINTEEYQRIQEASCKSNMLSLDEELSSSEDSHTTLQDLTAGRANQTSREDLQQDDMIRILEENISSLPEKERLVVAMYYYEQLTFKEIGQVLGVTESRICQLHSRAMLRLRSRLKSYELEFAASVA